MNEAANFGNQLSDEQRHSMIKQSDPRLTDELAVEYLEVLRERYRQKEEFLQRGYSNQMAERALDKQGWSRPWGWHTVFFYPDSNRMRTRYFVIFAAIIGVVLWRSGALG